MPLSTKSAKAKGRRLQNEVVDALKQAFGIPDTQIRARVMGEAGTDIVVDSAYFPFSLECKNTERLEIWKALAQAEINAKLDGKWPGLVFHRNRSQTYVAIPFDVLVEICQAAQLGTKRNNSHGC